MVEDDDGREGAADGDAGEGEGEDEVPTVVVATLADLGSYLPEGLLKGFGDRPAWFLREDDQELVEIFDHVPEDPMPKGRAHELLKALRQFTDAQSEELQRLLGPAESLVYAFHGDAPISRVVAAFEQDGFVVCTNVVRGGRVVLPEA
jgi:hypothetical protein